MQHHCRNNKPYQQQLNTLILPLGSRIAVLDDPIVVAVVVRGVVAVVVVVVAVAFSAAAVVGLCSGHLEACWSHPETKAQPTTT